MFAALALAVFVATACVDYAHGRYVANFVEKHGHRAGCWSAASGAAGAVGFVLAVKITMWLVLFELGGLYAGTRLAVWRERRAPPPLPRKCPRTNM